MNMVSGWTSLCRRWLICGVVGSLVAAAEGAAGVKLEAGDHIAIVGAGLAERQQHHAWLETLIHAAYPKLELTIRNFGFSADEVNLHPRSANVPPLEYFLSMKKGDTRWPGSPAVYKAGTDFGADVIIAYWGFNESFNGEGKLPEFKRNLGAWIESQKKADYNGNGPPRLVIASPIAMEVSSLPVGTRDHNPVLALYVEAMREVAASKEVPFIDLYHPSLDLYKSAPHPLTINGIHLTEVGDKALAPIQFKALFDREAESLDNARIERIRATVLDKNREWHHRYRTVDQYNIYGERSLIKYEGITNAIIMNQEMAQRDVKTANRDRRIWAIAQGRDLQVIDDNLPPVASVPPNRPEAIPYPDPEEAIRYLNLPKGLKVELIASEKTYPELVNPVQMAFDTKGRLWIAAWKNYPETSPTTKDFDKLLVFELDPATGKPVKMTTFLDGLNCPTGFQFYKDGVLVMQSPDLWYVRDTDGDGKADWKERVLSGLDAADSHHETNSMCLEPGGAVYLSDGVFHRTNVETANGPVRNVDGGIYRYEPRTGKFMRHAPYPFANPHGRVFDYWGNDLITDATGNDNYFGPAMSGHLDEGAHPSMKTFWNRPARPTPGTAILSSRHFPDDWQGLFLNANVLGVQGIFRAKLSEEGSGIKGQTLEHLVAADVSKHPNFRPSGITVAPDGSLYFMDWSQMLIGHLQHHLRDPNRDHLHGRIYRITYQGRPLLVPKKIDGEPLPALLELLKEPENDVRLRAKIELGKRSTPEVIAAVKTWLRHLDPRAAQYEHHRLEALWIYQWHDVVNLDLLEQVLNSPEPRARAQAVRVMGYWRVRVPGALDLLMKAANDNSPRVRLEAVRVASFFRDAKAADVALATLNHPSDYYLDYCRSETIRQLKPWWMAALKEGRPIAGNHPAGIDYLIKILTAHELAELPQSILSLNALLLKDDSSEEQRREALSSLATLKGLSPTQVLLDTLFADRKGKGNELLASLLPSQAPEDLQHEHERLEALAASAKGSSVGRYASAAWITADGNLKTFWTGATANSSAMLEFLEIIRLVKEPRLRAQAADLLANVLERMPGSIESEGTSDHGARFVRIELPRAGTLTLAEVEIFSEGQNIALTGMATQSSTAYGGVAKRAIDGNSDGDFASNTQTHTREGERDPWWEIDLKSPRPVSMVKVWNRKDFEQRLDGFTLVLLDSNRKELFRKEKLPAPHRSAKIDIQLDSVARVKLTILSTLFELGGDPAKVFQAIARLIGKGEMVPDAVKNLRALPRASWNGEQAVSAVAGILKWARALPSEERHGAEFEKTIQGGIELAKVLPPQYSERAVKALQEMVMPHFIISAVREQLSFDSKRIVVEAGRTFRITFRNPDAMPHNIVFVMPGTMREIAEEVQTHAPDKLDSLGRAYVPDNDKRILGATRLLEPNTEETIEIHAPTQEGNYEFVCTFPGHWSVMHGKLIVTKNVDLYQKKNPQ